ncbi:hypothetical protein WEB32_32405 [Streptomyces netropsis]|uniref:Uncharacterized protein n=1 Tax=Streptomyces netropsis TaxID=55404 RepID=A0A7W7L872_STRNE|nr:hypothetical protein [Streptomyces netropsis]MBB4885450.1 hypothetical protein [Streptomyces netropsis]GGR38241.1 hypothetical protein GCM10010219_49160 [Streptomyces netropsis]
MRSPKPELIWQGRIHLGDEPGLYDDAHYSGLSAEVPLTLERADPQGDATALVVVTEGVETFTGYPGHLITVTAYLPDPARPYHSVETVLATARITSADQNRKEIPLALANRPSPLFVSVRVRIDTEVPPGLYDDFVLTRILHASQNFAFVASLGFHI